MRRAIWILIAACAMPNWASAATATAHPAVVDPYQDARPRVASLLELTAVNSDAGAAAVYAALAQLERADIAELCDLLVVPGVGDDTRARMALHALGWYVQGPDRHEDRADFVEVLSEKLRSDAHPAVKRYLIHQLQLGGGTGATPALGALLPDTELCAAATRALLEIGDPSAATVIRAALQKAQGRNRVTLIDALGRLRDRESVPVLLGDAASDDADVRFAALAALCNIGERAAADALRATVVDDSWYNRSRLYGFMATLADRIAEGGDPIEAARLYAVLLRSGRAAPDPHLKCAALHGLVRARGVAALDAIVGGVISSDPEVRGTAMELAVAITGDGVTEAYVKLLQRASPAVRAAILTILARRGDKAALPQALGRINDRNKDVRLAALTATARLGGEEMVHELIGYLHTVNLDERAIARKLILEMPGGTVNQRIAAAVTKAQPEIGAVLIEILVDRRAVAQLELVTALTRHAEAPVRIAAIRAVGALAEPPAAALLLERLSAAATDMEREAIETALAEVCSRDTNAASKAAPVLAALHADDATEYASLLRVLGRIGGRAALVAIRTATTDPRQPVRDAAYRALAVWPDAKTADELPALAREARALNHHVLVMRAFARLLPADGERPVERVLALVQAGLDASRRPEEKTLLLSKLGNVADLRAVAALRPYLRDEALAAEAAAAMINVADRLLPAGWAAARQTVEEALAATEVETVRRRGAEVLRRVGEHEDFITEWLVAGPYMKAGRRGNQVFDVRFAPEPPADAGVEWQEQPLSKDAARYWLVDLNQSCGAPNSAVYLSTSLFSPEAQAARLELGSDDGIKVWLNGQVVHANNALRGCQRSEDLVDVRLEKGANALLLKVTNNGGAFAACVRLRAPDGGRLDGVHATLERRP